MHDWIVLIVLFSGFCRQYLPSVVSASHLGKSGDVYGCTPAHRCKMRELKDQFRIDIDFNFYYNIRRKLHEEKTPAVAYCIPGGASD
jgi:hypothetical protein